MNRARFAETLVLLVAVAHCGGGAVSGSSGDASVRSDASGTVGSTDATAPDVGSGASDGATLTETGSADGSACQSAFLEAGSGRAGDAEIPVYHRAQPACCPTERGPAPSGQPYGAGEAAGCASDSQCKSGLDGRCFPFEGLVGPGGCSYDACLTDSDCPSGAACLCRRSASDTSANSCVAGGNCVLDSDCGGGGYCSPSEGCGGPVAYYCHTPADTCINDEDCPPATSTGCAVLAACTYDPQMKHWGCTQQVCCPP